VRTRFTRFGTTLALTALAGACLFIASGVALAQGPQIPGAETARFRVVVEGTAQDTSDLDAGGSTGVCDVQVNAHVTERSTYRRGRGVIVEFLRVGTGRRAPVILRRVGRFGPVTFSVDVAVTRDASGFATRTNAANIPPEACPPLTEDLSQGSECGTPETFKTTMSLTLPRRNALSLQLVGLGMILEIKCPDGQIVPATDFTLPLGWPTPPKLGPELVPLGQVFGTRRVIIVRPDSLQRRTTERFAQGPVTGSGSHFARNRAIIRLIRVP
jgi:hypothetical protein